MFKLKFTEIVQRDIRLMKELSDKVYVLGKERLTWLEFTQLNTVFLLLYS